MDNLKVKKYKGKDLPIFVMAQLNEIWNKVFEHNDPLEAEQREKFTNDIFFILEDKDQNLLSSGRLRPVEIELLGKKYLIQGISDIVSNIQGKGYGGMVMKEMKKYILENNEVGVGFCEKKNSPFYLKRGYKIFPDLMNRFFYKNKKGEWQTYNDDVLFCAKNDSLINTILAHPTEKIIISIPHW